MLSVFAGLKQRFSNIRGASASLSFSVLVMKNDPSLNYAMAGLYRSAVTVSALIVSLSVSVVYAADPPVPRSNVSVTVNPTTGYYSSTSSTFRIPHGVSVSPVTTSVPVVTKYPAGLQQTIPTGITIDAIKKSAPLPAVVRSSTQSLKSAATRCLTSARCNVAQLLAGAGINKLLDDLDWIMGEGGKIQKKSSDSIFTLPEGVPHGYTSWSYRTMSYTGTTSCGERAGRVCIGYDGQYSYYCDTKYGIPTGTFVDNSIAKCYYGGTPPTSTSELVLVSDSDIESGVNSNYSPEPSDWPALTPELKLDDVEITSSPTLQGEPKTTTVYDADGNPHEITETNIWYDFDIRDNGSSQPALDLKKREETKTYKDGVLTGTTTTESTDSSGSGGGGGGGSGKETPTDCAFFPTLCKWLDWTQEKPTEPDDDLSGLLKEVPIVSETFTITGGVAACPAPMVLDLSVFGSHEVSYQPLCDLASKMKYLYLALMSFFAAVLLHRSINRV